MPLTIDTNHDSRKAGCVHTKGKCLVDVWLTALVEAAVSIVAAVYWGASTTDNVKHKVLNSNWILLPPSSQGLLTSDCAG